MGAAHSNEPRTVSMDNPNPGIIDLSDEVVGRLKKGIAQQEKAKKAADTPAPPQQQQQPKAAPKKERVVPIRPPPPPQQTIVYQNAPASSIFMPASGPTMTAADVNRQKEIELQQNDQLWRQRMRDLEVTLNKTNAIMEKEYSTAMEDVRARFANASAVHQLPPCQDLKAKVIACYKANRGETLKCADEVAQFRNCVSLHRVQKLDAEEKAEQAKAAAAKAAAAEPAKAPAVKAG